MKNKKVIYKYSLNWDKEQKIRIDSEAIVLDVQVQYSAITLWALVDPDPQDIDEITVYVFETGEPIQQDISNLKYLGTLQFDDGMFIYHVFMEKNNNV